jgi:Uncharacterised protein family (UPF0175)
MTDVTIHLPEDVAEELMGKCGADLPRAVLEMVALEGYRSGDLTHAQVMRLLAFKNRVEVDGFLRRAGLHLEYTEADLEREENLHDRVFGMGPSCPANQAIKRSSSISD